MYHKTTHRLVYKTAKTQAGDCDDVILFNTKNEVTETGIANIVIRLGSELVTPPVSCGLLAGTFRDHLVHAGKSRNLFCQLTR